MILYVRFGDLTLKGRNQNLFKKALYQELNSRIKDLDIELTKAYDHFYLEFTDDKYDLVYDILNHLPGLHSFSVVLKLKKDVDLLKSTCLAYLKETVSKNTSFKLKVKRSDKTFSLRSMELTKDLSAYLLLNFPLIYVDVHNPELLLKVDVRNDGIFIFKNKVMLLGGFPPGIANKALCLISGGIDSPVASFLMEKQGVEIECIHFESTPLTSLESAMKVYELCNILSKYNKNSKMKLYFVPFKTIHMEILSKIPDSYRITVMRRMMYRIAEEIALRNNCLCLVSGESVGQVASQTLASMNTINNVINMAHIRPLSGFDKKDIIEISKKIGTFETSIRPFEDCCTVYVPKNPIINPTIERSEKYEENFDYKTLVADACDNTRYLICDKDSDLVFSELGFDMNDVFRSICEKA